MDVSLAKFALSFDRKRAELAMTGGIFA